MFINVSHFIDSVANHAYLLPLSIALCALFLEDITTVIVGVLASDGSIGVPLALLSIYGGVALGDTCLYLLGVFARTHPRLARYIEHEATAPFRTWLMLSYRFKVFSGHFVPGLRFTTFVTSGFFRFPLRHYVPSAIAGGLVLVGVLFTLSYWFGSVTTGWLSHARWGIAVVFLVALFLIGRRNLLAYRTQQTAVPENTSVPS